MSDLYLEYTLQDGYVHDWLVAGPQATALDDLERFPADGLRLQVARDFLRRFCEVDQPPVELGTFQVGESELEWRYYGCQDDHLVDLSSTYPTPQYLRSWAYARLVSPSAQTATFHLTTNGPSDVWLNRQHAHRQEHWDRHPRTGAFGASLEEGTNEILVRFEATAIRECPYTMALQLQGVLSEELSVHIPTYHENIYRRQKLQRVYEQAHIEHLVSVRGAEVAFRWDDEIEFDDQVGYWLRDESGLITVYGHAYTKPSERVLLGQGHITLHQGAHHIALIPPTHVIERYGIRYQKQFPFYVLEHPFSEAYYGTYAQRRQEALAHSQRQEGHLYGALAGIALDRWAAVDQDVLRRAIDRAQHREADSAPALLGLLGALGRHPGAPILAAIVFHACEILAGQRYPESTFLRAGQSGRWHLEKGEGLARQWLHERGSQGFAEWDSPSCFERDIVALTHLADLAADAGIREWAQIVLDKLCFTVAINSFKGVYGSTQRHARAWMIRSGQLQATSGITRLLWGTGVWNQHIAGLVALATSEYELPSMIASIAVDLDEEMWHKEHHLGVDKVTYRTPDYMLCSAQDHHPGDRGGDEQIWQATLGSDAVVFANHPRSMSGSDAQRPNFWAGNQVLPRVAQHRDALIAIYNLPDDDWLGFCHAYFPVYEFDEWETEGGWAFARRGQGYLALACSQELQLVRRGPGAFRELRADSQQQVWLCLMGREATDGPFSGFQDKVKALDVAWQPLSITCQTHRGQTLSFAWEGPFTVDSVHQPLEGYAHYDGPHCTAEWPCTQMDIQYGDYALRLRFDA